MLSSLTPQRLVRVTIPSTLLEKQNENNEVPLISSCGPHDDCNSDDEVRDLGINFFDIALQLLLLLILFSASWGISAAILLT